MKQMNSSLAKLKSFFLQMDAVKVNCNQNYRKNRKAQRPWTKGGEIEG